jgi:hypothetical protein
LQQEVFAGAALQDFALLSQAFCFFWHFAAFCAHACFAEAHGVHFFVSHFPVLHWVLSAQTHFASALAGAAHCCAAAVNAIPVNIANAAAIVAIFFIINHLLLFLVMRV